MAATAHFLVFLSLCQYIQWNYALSLSHEDHAYSIIGSAGERTLRRRPRSLASSITSLNVTSVVMSRFARVTYRSRIENNRDEDTEVTFSVVLPEAAFITEFDMVVDGITFVGTVKAKDIAARQYNEAIENGNAAGLVKADVRESQTFDVSANVPAQSSVDFHLVYQELLQRRHGIYNHVIHIDATEVVDDMCVTVYITEKTGITSLEALGPKLGAVPTGSGMIDIRSVDSDIRRSKQQAKITFKPSATEQRLLLNLPEKERKFIVKYDVTRVSLGGEIQTRDGYFVHFFAPEGLPILPKTVIFVIDVSGSMMEKKLEQTKAAFTSVLGELRTYDKFNIITFSSHVSVWESSQRIVNATKQNVLRATRYVERITASGGTNFYAGLQEGVDLLREISLTESNSPMIVILTDGRPTAGVINKVQIRLKIRMQVQRRFSIFCLGFGEDLDHKFLKRLASENNGLARKIYEESDAGLQLEGFFKEVATPLLMNVSLNYPDQRVHGVTTAEYDKYFSGSEVIVVGSYDGGDINLRSVVRGTSRSGGVTYNVTSREIDDSFQHWFRDTGDFSLFIERMWVHLTIKERLKQRDLVDSEDPRIQCVSAEVTPCLTLMLDDTSGARTYWEIARTSEVEFLTILKLWMSNHTEVIEITKNGKRILQHLGGAATPRYMPITDNELHVEMIVDQSDKRRPGVVISYEQFQPSERVDIDTASTDPVDVFNVANLSCGETFASSAFQHGYVSSPNYPLSYPGDSLCVWTFVNEDPENIELRITFNATDIEASGDQCPHDRVILQDGANERAICGFEIPQSLVSREGIVRMAFVSDSFLEAAGFLARYEFVPAG